MTKRNDPKPTGIDGPNYTAAFPYGNTAEENAALLRAIEEAAQNPYELPAAAFEPWTREQLDAWHERHAALTVEQCPFDPCPAHGK